MPWMEFFNEKVWLLRLKFLCLVRDYLLGNLTSNCKMYQERNIKWYCYFTLRMGKSYVNKVKRQGLNFQEKENEAGKNVEKIC